ncbi:hypothetical protein, partial [Bacillus toyonensis]|uniref:hypothetical protein n=1 Tax=Bacillus toyonensis TaxID=155322 RepID=UPI001C3F2197
LMVIRLIPPFMDSTNVQANEPIHTGSFVSIYIIDRKEFQVYRLFEPSMFLCYLFQTRYIIICF